MADSEIVDAANEDRRRDEILLHMLKTPPKPRKAKDAQPKAAQAPKDRA